MLLLRPSDRDDRWGVEGGRMGIQKVLGFEVGFCESNGEGEETIRGRKRERKRILGFGASHASEICGGKCEGGRERQKE